MGLRLTEQEYDCLYRKAGEDPCMHYKNGTVNLSGYIREKALGESGYREERLQKEMKELAYQMKKIGVNINQATKKINSGYGTVKAASELQNGLSQMNRNFMELMEKLEGNEGKHGNHETDEY